ncbi:VOC family protein [Microlunatus speluncae]|uniref:VOC family protein n=1 Tax=Microlunatus speluncae TaxID=2594267 RepID=UPI0012662D47|nr:VOC family protein [Microlunatus speluncae]
MPDDERLTAREFRQATGVEDWRVLADGAEAWFDTSSHTAGAALIHRIIELTGAEERRPELDLRATGVRVRIGAGDPDGLVPADLDTARVISAAARDLALTADPSALQSFRVAFAAQDPEPILTFWRDVLGYRPDGADGLVDPLRRDPAVCCRQVDEPRPLRNRFHLDVARPHPIVLDTLATIKAAGAREAFVGDYYGTIADADGNEVDLIPLAPGGDRLSGEQLGGDGSDWGPETADWRILFGAMIFYPVAAPLRAAELAGTVARIADGAGLPLLIDLRPDGVMIDTAKDQWEDVRFAELAPKVQAAARGMSLTADQTPLRFVQVGIDAVDVPVVRAFWCAALGYELDPRPFVTDLYDPRRLNPPVFFQLITEPAEERLRQRNRTRIELSLPGDQVATRVESALAAGGRVRDEEAVDGRWLIADPEGNEVLIIAG